MNDTKIASKAKAQLANFMGKVFTHFSKPTRRFIEEWIYGIQASGDAKLSIGGRKTIPLALRLWSSRAPGFKGGNDEILNIVKSVYAATGGKGVMVYDRGGDRPAFYAYLIENNRNFIIRLKGRSVIFLKCTSPFIYWGEMHFRVQKMGKLQPSWDSCESDGSRGENKKAPENRSLLLNMRNRT